MGVTALAGAFVAGPAGADNAEAYLGSAAARGLNISVRTPLQQASSVQATLGSASAKITSGMTAEATGIGQVLPPVAETTKSATANAQSPTANGGTGCAQALPVGDIVSLGLACGSATATVVNNLPVATAKGSIASLDLEGQVALNNLDAVTTPIGGVLGGVLDTVCDTLAQTCDATTTVTDLVNSILDTQTLNVAVGESTANVVTDAAKVTSSATASGAVVRILPLPQVNGLPSTDPVATIEVSSAKATAVYDRAAGKTLTPVADPAVVRVKFNTVLTQALGIGEIAVQPGVTRRILEGTPLESEIRVAGTQIVNNADGTQGAIADGVKLHLLMPLGESAVGALDGGVMLELAHAEAGVGGIAAQVTPVTPQLDTPRDIPAELPRTGGTPWVPLAGAVVLSLAVVARRAGLKAAAVKADSNS